MNLPFQPEALNGVSTLLFDLGQVIINLDTQATETAFKNIFGADYQRFKTLTAENQLFERFETGHIDQEAFLQALTSLSPQPVPTTQLVKAWNAMLLDIPSPRLNMLESLRQQYRIMLLSNTNSIHIEYVYGYLESTHNITNWEDRFFDKAYYSHLMGLRKPHQEIYEAVLNDNQLNADEVLFIDDNADNIAGAKNLGIRTLHHNPVQDITHIFHNYHS